MSKKLVLGYKWSNKIWESFATQLLLKYEPGRSFPLSTPVSAKGIYKAHKIEVKGSMPTTYSLSSFETSFKVELSVLSPFLMKIIWKNWYIKILTKLGIKTRVAVPQETIDKNGRKQEKLRWFFSTSRYINRRC
jgi:hypothetical protein